MAQKFSFIEHLIPRRVDSKIKVSIIRLYQVPNFKYPLQTNTIEMVPIDEKCARIHATLKRSLIGNILCLLLMMLYGWVSFGAYMVNLLPKSLARSPATV
ncbi:hypothetical protein E2542_SST09238 [Spatholobus suberectus]|nr:hypothetical protein E2542_SST09238 [Spatholobus suberectus]